MKNPLRRKRAAARIQAVADQLRTRTSRTAKFPWALLGGLGAGALLMYGLDPDHGKRRRAIARDKMASACRTTSERAQATFKDARNRTYGLYAEGRKRFGKQAVSDDILQARVRSKLGRYTRYPHAIEVSVNQGNVRLRGPALAQDADRLITQIARLRGVQAIDNDLQLHDEPGNIPALQGVYDAPPAAAQWTPTQRAAAGAAGTSLLVGGLLRRGGPGIALGALGAGLLAAGALTGARRRNTSKTRPSL